MRRILKVLKAGKFILFREVGMVKRKASEIEVSLDRYIRIWCGVSAGYLLRLCDEVFGAYANAVDGGQLP